MKQTDSSDNSPVGVTNTHLDSKGYYFANGVNIIPGQNMPLDNITRKQAQDILKSEIINHIDSEDFKIIKQIAESPELTVPTPTRVGQVLTSKLVDGKLEPVWDDLGNDANFATTIATQMDKRVRVDAAQSFTVAEQAQGCANLGIGNLDTDLLAVYTTAKA